MSEANITGRDTYIIVEALAFTVEALNRLPVELRSNNTIIDMKRLIGQFVKTDTGLAQSQLVAHRRLEYVLTYGRPDRS